MDGLILVDKPTGMTSFQVVKRLRWLTKVKKVGHAGTLDPMASGLLPVCLGKATKLVQFIMKGEKVYEGVMKLGVSTDSYDAEGTVTAKKTVPWNLTIDDLRRHAIAFTGRIRQVPPPFSALKVNGKPLYEYARKGQMIFKEAREVEVSVFDITRFEGSYVYFQVKCSSGTYIRSLAHDLGETLGCGAHLVSLKRTSVSPAGCADKDGKEFVFDVSRAWSMERLCELSSEDGLERAVISLMDVKTILKQ